MRSPGTLSTRPRSSARAATALASDPGAKRDPDHQAAAPDLVDRVDLAEPGAQAAAELADAAEQGRLIDHLERRERRRSSDRRAGEGRAVVAAAEGLGERRGADHGADREPAPERLRRRQQVGAHRKLLVRPQAPGPSHPALDLVEDQHGARPVAGLAGGDQDLVGDREDPGLALDRLDDHGRRALAHRGAQRLRVVAPDRDEAPRQGAEEVLAGEPGGRGQRCHRAAVKGALEGDDLGPLDPVTVGALADELDRALASPRRRSCRGRRARRGSTR